MPRRRQAGEGCISEYQTKRQGPRYLIKYAAPTADGLATTMVLRRGFKSRTEAAAELREQLTNVDKGTHVAPSNLTLAEYLSDQWLPALRLEASTSASYRRNCRLHVIPHLGSMKLGSITGTRLTALYRKLEESGRRDHKDGDGLAPRTVRYLHTIVHAALGDAVQVGLLAVNPADKAKPPTAAQAASPELHYWEPAQLRAFLGWCDRDRDDLLVAWQLLASTGMRRGEALALRWKDVDLERGVVSVRRNAVLVREHGAGEKVIVKPPKSGKARVIDIDPRTVAALKAQRALLASIDLQAARGDAVVLPARDGGVRHPERFSRTFLSRLSRARKALGEAELPMIRLHDLRHTHATALLVAGVHPKVVQERLGHASIGITLNTYSHVIPTMQRQAADAFGAAVFGA